MTSNRACGSAIAFSGMNSAPVFGSARTEWRWLNVPRPESCPERRTGVPSRRSIPKASISPPAQSISGRPFA